jgi:hypothetical protein
MMPIQPDVTVEIRDVLNLCHSCSGRSMVCMGMADYNSLLEVEAFFLEFLQHSLG